MVAAIAPAAPWTLAWAVKVSGAPAPRGVCWAPGDAASTSKAKRARDGTRTSASFRNDEKRRVRSRFLIPTPGLWHPPPATSRERFVVVVPRGKEQQIPLDLPV